MKGLLVSSLLVFSWGASGNGLSPIGLRGDSLQFKVGFKNSNSSIYSETRLEQWSGFSIPEIPYSIWSVAAKSGTPIYLLPNYPASAADAGAVGTVASILSLMATTRNASLEIPALKERLIKRLGVGVNFITTTYSVSEDGDVTTDVVTEAVEDIAYSLPVLYLQLGPNTSGAALEMKSENVLQDGESPLMTIPKIELPVAPGYIRVNVGSPTYVTIERDGVEGDLVTDGTEIKMGPCGDEDNKKKRLLICKLGGGSTYKDPNDVEYDLSKGVFISWEGGDFASGSRLDSAKKAIGDTIKENFASVGSVYPVPGLISISLSPYFSGTTSNATMRFSVRFI